MEATDPPEITVRGIVQAGCSGAQTDNLSTPPIFRNHRKPPKSSATTRQEPILSVLDESEGGGLGSIRQRRLASATWFVVLLDDLSVPALTA